MLMIWYICGMGTDLFADNPSLVLFNDFFINKEI